MFNQVSLLNTYILKIMPVEKIVKIIYCKIINPDILTFSNLKLLTGLRLENRLIETNRHRYPVRGGLDDSQTNDPALDNRFAAVGGRCCRRGAVGVLPTRSK
jgi:hypothetical protein